MLPTTRYDVMSSIVTQLLSQ